MAIDFTVPDAVPVNLPQLAARGISVVVGTTGWLAHEAALRAEAARAGIGVVASANFSLGMNVFLLLAEDAARRFAALEDVGAWIHELHHAAKQDAPSGTALLLQQAMVGAGYARRHRRGREPRRLDSRDPYHRLRRTVGDRDAHPHGARPRRVRPRRARGGALAGRPARLVHDARCPDYWHWRLNMRTRFTGVGTALITPFTTSGAVDEAAVRRLARRQIDGGTHFLVPCGTTGEVPTLSAEERRRVVELVVDEAAGKTPVLAGAGGYDTREVAHAAAEMHAAGADGLLSVTPYYNRPTPDGLFQHYSAIAGATPLPIVVYNVPGRTGCNVDPATLARLATIPTVIGVKEAAGNMTQMAEMINAVPEDFLVLSGDDALTVPLMAIGGRGIISVCSNQIPREMADMVEAAERGDFAAARTIHRRVLGLMQVNFCESSPGPVKFSMAAMGLCDEVFRLPMVPPRQSSRDKVLAVMRELGLPIVSSAAA